MSLSINISADLFYVMGANRKDLTLWKQLCQLRLDVIAGAVAEVCDNARQDLGPVRCLGICLDSFHCAPAFFISRVFDVGNGIGHIANTLGQFTVSDDPIKSGDVGIGREVVQADNDVSDLLNRC